MSKTEIGSTMMSKALVVSRSARSSAPPNPWVGAVLARGERLIAQGATEPYGGRHAERVALEGVADVGHDDVLYVTLEPCAHLGRTPPCVEAIIASGVRQCEVGVIDADSKVAGKGIRALIEGGVSVRLGRCEASVVEELAPYLYQRITGRPWVTLKLAMTLDGKIAAADGTSGWITSPQSRHEVHELREISQAIIVGSGTIRKDNPSLTARTPDGTLRPYQPERIVLGDIPANAAVLPARSHFGDLAGLLDELGREGLIRVLVEGGAEAAGEFHDGGYVNEYRLYLAPALMGQQGLSGIGGRGTKTITELWRSEFSEVRRVGPDLMVSVIAPSTKEILDAHRLASFNLSQSLEIPWVGEPGIAG